MIYNGRSQWLTKRDGDGIMLLKYNTEKLKKVIDDFHITTGIPVSVCGVDGKQLARSGPETKNRFCKLVQSTAAGLERCRASDDRLIAEATKRRCAVSCRCHAGLADTVVPIYAQSQFLGSVIFGQIGDAEGQKTPFAEVYEMVKDLGLDEGELREAYESFYFFDRRQLESATEIVTILIKYILLEHIIEPEFESEIQNIVSYIDENLSEDLSVAKLCRKFLISKNTLYGIFREHFDCSVKEYVLSRRMESAEKMLKTTSYSVRQVGERCGLGNYQYFCRVFKQQNGDTPLQFRKKWELEQKRKAVL